jgi:hypothetical protein
MREYRKRGALAADCQGRWAAGHAVALATVTEGKRGAEWEVYVWVGGA